MEKKLNNRWYDDLCWCPSQCSYYFDGIDGKHYEIYLRWRWCDPWSASLFELNDLGDIVSDTDIELSRDYGQQELDDLKKEVIERFNSISYKALCRL